MKQITCHNCGETYPDFDVAHVCGPVSLMNDVTYATASQPMDEYEEDFDIVVSTLQKQIDLFEKMNKDSARVAMNMDWGGIGIMDEIRYEQIWQMKKAIKIWKLLKDELA